MGTCWSKVRTRTTSFRYTEKTDVGGYEVTTQAPSDNSYQTPKEQQADKPISSIYDVKTEENQMNDGEQVKVNIRIRNTQRITHAKPLTMLRTAVTIMQLYCFSGPHSEGREWNNCG